MNKNVAIVVVILILALVAGYLVWLRNQYQPSSYVSLERVEVSPTPIVASPSATATASTTITR